MRVCVRARLISRRTLASAWERLMIDGRACAERSWDGARLEVRAMCVVALKDASASCAGALHVPVDYLLAEALLSEVCGGALGVRHHTRAVPVLLVDPPARTRGSTDRGCPVAVAVRGQGSQACALGGDSVRSSRAAWVPPPR